MSPTWTAPWGFYTEAFGASAVFSSAEWSEATVAGATVALHPGGDGTESAGLGFEVDDLDAALLQVTRVAGRTNPLWFTPPEEQEPHRRTLTC